MKAGHSSAAVRRTPDAIADWLIVPGFPCKLDGAVTRIVAVRPIPTVTPAGEVNA